MPRTNLNFYELKWYDPTTGDFIDKPIELANTADSSIKFNRLITANAGVFSYVRFNNIGDADYTLKLSDNSKALISEASSARIINVPDNFPVGYNIVIILTGTDTVTFSSATDSIHSVDGALALVTQYASASLIKYNETSWHLAGNIGSSI